MNTIQAKLHRRWVEAEREYDRAWVAWVDLRHSVGSGPRGRAPRVIAAQDKELRAQLTAARMGRDKAKRMLQAKVK